MAIEAHLAEDISITDLVEELSAQAKAVQQGNLDRPEALLIAQAHTLDLLFNRLTRRAMSCNTVEPFEAKMRMALRAQSQCTRTLEVLATIKNPPLVIAEHANVTTGPQQDNFGVARGGNENKPTELLGASDGKRLDAVAAAQAVGGNSALEAVDSQHRA